MIHWENSQCSNFNGSQAHTSTCVLWWSPLNTLACNVNHVVTALAQKPGETPPSPQCSPYIFRLVCSFLFLCLKDLQTGEKKRQQEALGTGGVEGSKFRYFQLGRDQKLLAALWSACEKKRAGACYRWPTYLWGGKKVIWCIGSFLWVETLLKIKFVMQMDFNTLIFVVRH